MWLTKLKKRVRPRERKRGRSARLPGNESEKYVIREMEFCAKEALRLRPDQRKSRRRAASPYGMTSLAD